MTVNAVTQYIGARYVPLFAEPLEWTSDRVYEPLTIVLHEGASYTSRQSVPLGIDITNEQYWALTGNYNAQVEQYRLETREAVQHVDEVGAQATESATQAANSAAAAKTSETNAAASATAAAGSATAAADSATQAANSAAAAKTSEDNVAATISAATEQAVADSTKAAADSAAAAAQSANNAALSATSASGSATQSFTAMSNAEGFKNEAETAATNAINAANAAGKSESTIDAKVASIEGTVTQVATNTSDIAALKQQIQHGHVTQSSSDTIPAGTMHTQTIKFPTAFKSTPSVSCMCVSSNTNTQPADAIGKIVASLSTVSSTEFGVNLVNVSGVDATYKHELYWVAVGDLDA